MVVEITVGIMAVVDRQEEEDKSINPITPKYLKKY